MVACSREVEDQFVIVDLIDQQPVRRDAALPAIVEISREGVVPVFAVKLLPERQGVDDAAEEVQVVAALAQAFEVFGETRCRDDSKVSHSRSRRSRRRS